MIRDKQVASLVINGLEEANKLLADSADMVKSRCTDAEYQAYRSGMAHVQGRLFFLVMEPIYREHPSLAPPDTPQEFISEWKRSKDRE